ncbi:hypothetical protein HAHE_16400 [Haloferula helveola]|uniref:Uncharacterized protein n=1 Tax=Haloferula helveola TaxID=490095 RepID=A0ABM7RDL0_9BACT|nr:hypothetical protein HAHE_16400 [Haloferula helveola]
MEEQPATEAINPYSTPSAPPASPPAIPGGSLTTTFFKDDVFLIVRDGAVLPPSCVSTGDETSDNDWRKQVPLSWNPPWVFLGLLGGLIPLVILILVCQKKAKVVYSLSPAASKRMLRLRGIGFGLLALAGVCLLAMIFGSLPDEAIGYTIVTMILALVASVVLFTAATPLKAIGHKNGWLKVKGADARFLEQIPQGNWAGL